MKRQTKAPSSGSSMRNARGLVAIAFACVAFLGTGASTAVASPATLSIDPVTEHGITTAKVSGEVSVPADGATNYWGFQYSEDGLSWSGSPFDGGPMEPGESSPVNATLSGLKANTTYKVRLSVFDFSDFTEHSVPDPNEPSPAYPEFTTDPAPVAPTATVEPAGSVSYTSAQIQGAVNPHGGNDEGGGAYVPIHWVLELSSDGSSFSSVASGDLTTGNGAESPGDVTVPPNPAEGELKNLTPSHTYSYKVVVTYAGEAPVESAIETFETLAVAKPSVENLAVPGVTDSAAHFSAEVDPNGSDEAFNASWEFTCVPECHGAKGAPLSGTVSGAKKTVEADAVELEPNTEYTVTLKASNAGGTEEESTTFPTPAIAPGVRDFAAGPVHSDSAQLNAEVNPHNSATVYWFEWGTADCSSNPCQVLPASKDADAGSGGRYLHVSQQLTGLTPQTTYHFRLLAESAAGTTEGADRTFGTPAVEPGCANEAIRVEQGSTDLPDCRAYEMVSPIDKNGGDVISSTFRVHAATDGSGLVYDSLTGFADAQGTGVDVDYLSERTGSGPTAWSTHAITPQQDPQTLASIGFIGGQTMYDAEFTPDLSRGIYRYAGARPEDANVQSVLNLYLRDDLRTPGPGDFQLLTQSVAPLNPLSPNRETQGPILAGASTDLSHVAFESRYNLTLDAAGGSRKLYEWANGTTRLAGILPDGSPADASLAGAGASLAQRTAHVVSSDGSRIFFAKGTFGEDGIFARIHGAISVQLNRSEKAAPEGPGPAQYRDASVDGSRVFFTTSEGLVDGDDNGESDLYMWKQADTDEVQEVSVDATGGTFSLSLYGRSSEPIPFDAGAAAVQAALEGIEGPAPDQYPLLPQGDVSVTGPAGGPYTVTFEGDLAGVDMPQLAPDSSALTGGGATATVSTTAPVANLTRISEDRFGADQPGVASVIGASADGRYVYFTAAEKLLPGANDRDELGGGGAGIYLWHEGALNYVGWIALDSDVTRNSSTTGGLGIASRVMASRVSPDGRRLLFVSHSDKGLAGRGGFAGADHGTTCGLDTGDVAGRCREIYLYDADTGALRCASCRVGGPAEGDAITAVRTGNGASPATYHLSAPLSDDGRYVFFSTDDALVPEDINSKFDVYEYDSVTETQRLLSSGTDPHDSYFMEATPSGSDVFFTTRERLSAWDTDEAVDVYDARIGGGFPEPVVGAAPCAGESCRTATPAGPATSPAGSGSLVGEGNPKPIRCPKGKRAIHRGGETRCVKKHHKHRKHKRPTKNNRRAGR